MTQLVGKYAAKKLLGKQLEKYQDRDPVGKSDPYYMWVQTGKKDRKGKEKFKKVKKQIPDYLPEGEALILAKMRQRAYWLDNSLFSFAGVRFGWSSVIGLIPAAGDVIDFILALLLVQRCSEVECGLGRYGFQMVVNCILDLIVGLVPIIGDIFDAMLRANSRNVRLLEKRLDEVYKTDAVKKRQSLLRVQPPPATELEDFDDDAEKLPRYRQDTDADLRRPQPARVPTETRGGERVEAKGKLSKSGSKHGRR